MTYLPYVVAVWIFVVGLYGIVTSRNLIHLVVCLSVAQASTYVFLLAVGYRSGGTAPIYKDVDEGTKSVDSVVHALTLTDIVVAVTVVALLLAIVVQAHKHNGTLDPNELRPFRG